MNKVKTHLAGTAMKGRAESGPTETAAPAARRAAPPPEYAAAPLRNRLWALCSSAPAEAYGPPWSSIAANLAARLQQELEALGASPAGRAPRSAVVAAAGCAGYAECVRVLARAAPAVHRILADVRGLALAADPDVPGPSAAPVPKNAPEPVVPCLPGLPLEYESLA